MKKESSTQQKIKSGESIGRSPILVIDNYDSFTYNLVHYLEAIGCEVIVKRNDQFQLEDLEVFHKIVLSPGPGLPDEAGMLKEVITRYAPSKSILGVCLGQQAIAEVFGGTLINLEEVYHGRATTVRVIKDDLLYKDIPKEFSAGRYHSWVVHTNLPGDLEVTAVDENGQIMSLRHKTHDVRAVQFHPESILTPYGKKILENWATAP